MIIYLATNTRNGKKYVGQTCRTLARRWQLHQNAAARGEGSHFQRAIRKHGAAAFTLTTIWVAESEQELNEMEIRFIATLNTRSPEGYNGTAGGEGGATMTGQTMPFRLTPPTAAVIRRQGEQAKAAEKAKTKQSKAPWKRKGCGSGCSSTRQLCLPFPLTIEQRAKRAQPGNKHSLGRHWKLSEETRKRQSTAQAGRTFSQEALNKMRAAQTRRRERELSDVTL
jgi:group I intron endonuclease